MAKKKKNEILDDVEEYLDNIGEDEVQGIVIPENIVEALLVAIAGGDRNAITNVGNDIKRIAEDQKPSKYKTHRH